jgi:hypothetical protein
VFGPNPSTGAVSVTGSPTVSNVEVQVALPNGTTTTTTGVPVFIDSGDNFGSIPASLAGQSSGTLPAGTVVSVYNSSGQLLYTYTTSATNGLTVTGSVMNTGIEAFAQPGKPVYISESPSGLGTTTFDT